MRSIEDLVRKTYFSLRLSAAVIAFAFPLILYIGGRIAHFHVQGSLSAYYHATRDTHGPNKEPCQVANPDAPVIYPESGVLRDWFVGLLFCIGAILHANKGATEKENIALSVAGLFAVGVAVFPMPWACRPDRHPSIHGICAMAFFTCIAFVCVFCSRDTINKLREGRRAFYHAVYGVLGVLMIGAPIVVYFLNTIARSDNKIFGAEVAGIYAFGAYWVFKSQEVREIQKYEGTHKRVETPSTLTVA
jgi:hypothetical protein